MNKLIQKIISQVFICIRFLYFYFGSLGINAQNYG